MKNTLLVTLSLVALLSGGCAKKADSAEAMDDAKKESAPAPAADEAEAADATDASGDSEEKATADVSASPLIPAAVAPTRLLVYHADLRMKVENLPRASTSLDSLVRRNGGYLSAATEARADGEWSQSMTIRVLPARFQPLMAALRGLGEVEEKKMTTDDVTAQHADIAARLATKRAMEKQYIALLSRAGKIKDVLEVETKIGEVREDIESTESRLRTLNDEVSYSTISLTCYQPIAQDMPDAPIVSFSSRLTESFYTGWSLITSLVIGMTAVWPFLLLGGAIWWGVRRLRQRTVKPKTETLEVK